MIWFVAASTPASFTVNLKDGVSRSATKNVAASSHLRGARVSRRWRTGAGVAAMARGRRLWYGPHAIDATLKEKDAGSSPRVVRVFGGLRLVLLAADLDIHEGGPSALLALVPRELGGLQDFDVDRSQE